MTCSHCQRKVTPKSNNTEPNQIYQNIAFGIAPKSTAITPVPILTPLRNNLQRLTVLARPSQSHKLVRDMKYSHKWKQWPQPSPSSSFHHYIIQSWPWTDDPQEWCEFYAAESTPFHRCSRQPQQLRNVRLDTSAALYPVPKLRLLLKEMPGSRLTSPQVPLQALRRNFRDTFLIDGSKSNIAMYASASGGSVGSIPHDWRGSMVVMRKRGLGIDPLCYMDITLADFRHIMDYFVGYRKEFYRAWD